MIVDVHYHMMLEVSEERVEAGVEHPVRAAGIMGRKIDRNTLIKRAKETWPDPGGEKLIASMDEAGIDYTVICTVDNADNELLTSKIAQSLNQKIAGIARKYPHRVMALAGVDPRRPNAPDMLRQCFEEFGMGGLKYHPDHGYDPCGPESYKLLGIVESNDGILLSHTGPLMSPARNKFADPMMLSDIGVDFPNLKVIAAHMGLVDWRPWAALATQQPNLYGDLAMWDAYAFGKYDLFCRELRDLIDYAGVSKVLFGTDGPIFGIVEPTKYWVQLIKNLPANAPSGINFTEAEVNAILGENAASLLGLDANDV